MNLSNPSESLADIQIQSLTPDHQELLWDLLYLAVFVPPGTAPPSRSILELPELQVYARDWGNPHDVGFLAKDRTGTVLGGAWSRLITGEVKGFGYIDDNTPELAIAVLSELRGQGIGTRLLTTLLGNLDRRHKKTCLSVDVVNPAVRLYKRMGFEKVKVSGQSMTMIRSRPT